MTTVLPMREEPFDAYSEFDLEEEETRGRRRGPARTGGRRRSPLQVRRPVRPQPPGRRPLPRWPSKLFVRPSIVVRPPPFPPPATPPAGAGGEPGAGAAAAAEPAPPEPQGSEFVRWTQDALNRVLKLRLPVDGVMGAETRSAVRSFQRRERLPVTGIVGPDTESKLIAAVEALDAELEELPLESEVDRASADYIRWVQRSLNRILGLRLAEDGVMGRQTRSAIRSFQRQRGLGVDGIVGRRTEEALLAAGAPRPPLPSPMPSPPTPGPAPQVVSVRGIRVARQIAPQAQALLAAAEADGIRLSGWGYRSAASQIELRRKHCGTTHYDIWDKPSSQCRPPTARPGRSMHEQGLAIDFTYEGKGIGSRSNPGFQWLATNAPRFGLHNLPSEPWHWSVNGR